MVGGTKIRPAATQGRPAAAPAVEKTAAAGWEELEQTEVQEVAKRATQTLVRVTMVRVEIHRPGPARNKSGLQTTAPGIHRCPGHTRVVVLFRVEEFGLRLGLGRGEVNLPLSLIHI